MIVEKIFNNNVILAKDKNNNEIVVMGRGLGYNKKIGNDIDESKIEKTFALKDDKKHVLQIIENIPEEYIELADDIVKEGKILLSKRLNDSILINLCDHIYTSIMRFNDGIIVRNTLIYDIKLFYPNEFDVGMMALERIKESFNVSLPVDEAGFIALHFINAQMDNDAEVEKVIQAMNEIINLVRNIYGTELDKTSVSFYRFITHLKFFTQRLFSGNTYTEEDDDGLLDVIKVKYRSAYLCVKKIEQFILNKYEYVLSNEEILYLTIHIARAVNESEKKKN